MAVSNTNIQAYCSDFATYQTAKQSLTTNNLSDLDYAETFFKELKWTVERIAVAEVKLIYGWLSLKKRDELYDRCLKAGFLLVERFDELNSTYQDFFTVLFKYRQAAGSLCAIQWNGNNPTITRPLQELIIAA
jgi:hypothetical protein